MRELITGNMAAAIGARLSRPQVIAAYPITPQTTIIEYLAKMVYDSELKAEYIKVESEHSAMAACVGAGAAGSRVFTATSSHGLALMHEMLWQASGLRLPVVMVNVNRALGAPWNIGSDQADSLAQRDTGWIQFYCEDSQEVLDMVVLGFRLAEAVSLPVMIVSEGFILSHTGAPVDILSQEEADAFLPPYNPLMKLDVENPITIGAHAYPHLYTEFRRDIQRAMDDVKKEYSKITGEFYTLSGRDYPPVEYIGSPNPELLLITSGTTSGTARAVIEENYGDKVALMKIRMFRPFPSFLIRSLSWRAAKIAVIDRNISFGSRGIFAEAVRSSLYNAPNRPPMFEFILGIGGVDITPEIIRKTIDFAMDESNPSWLKAVWQEELE